jgi:hypothetical protein
MTARGAASASCASCGARLQRGQRYCIECGERDAERSPQLLALLGALSDGASAASERADAGEAGTAVDARTETARRRRGPGAWLAFVSLRLGELRLPSARVSAVLVLAFVGFGALLGSAVSPRVADTLAASARPALKLVLPPASAATASSSEASTPSSQPPAVEAEAAPEALAAEASSPSAPVSSTASAPAASHRSREAPGAGGGQGGATPAGGAGSTLPPIKHVFVVLLSDQPYAAAFGPESGAPYLARTLEHRGALLVRYYAVAHEQLANGIALLSGQGPTPATAANCPTYAPLAPATPAGEGQFLGEGCVYPPSTPTLLGQLEVKRLTWRAYVQGIDEPGTAAAGCAHPAPAQPDPSSEPSASGPYATFRNPIVYFDGLIESPSCTADDVGLSSLDGDLARASRTPSLSVIVPDRCHDGSPGPCPGGAAGGLAGADAFLEAVVPKVLASKAYEQSGLLVITTDEAPSSGEFADSSSCCGQPRFPNMPAPSGLAASLPPEGGGQVGALLLSPFVKPRTISQEPYDHYSLLRTIEDLFGLKHLGYAGGAHVGAFEPSLFAAKPSK